VPSPPSEEPSPPLVEAISGPTLHDIKWEDQDNKQIELDQAALVEGLSVSDMISTVPPSPIHHPPAVVSSSSAAESETSAAAGANSEQNTTASIESQLVSLLETASSESAPEPSADASAASSIGVIIDMPLTDAASADAGHTFTGWHRTEGEPEQQRRSSSSINAPTTTSNIMINGVSSGTRRPQSSRSSTRDTHPQTLHNYNYNHSKKNLVPRPPSVTG
jgi:hypothetical protein